jgi:hypothetical protein
MDIERSRSAPSVLKARKDNDFAWSDAASYDYTTSSETDEEGEQPSLSRKRKNKENQYKPDNHARLTTYTREVHGLMKEAMERFLADHDKGTEPFPAYSEEGYIEETVPTEAVGVFACLPPPNQQSPDVNDSLSAETETSCIDGDGNPFILPSSIDQQDPGTSNETPLGSSRLNWRKACYSGLSQHPKDAKGNTMSTSEARLSKIV